LRRFIAGHNVPVNIAEVKRFTLDGDSVIQPVGASCNAFAPHGQVVLIRGCGACEVANEADTDFHFGKTDGFRTFFEMD